MQDTDSIVAALESMTSPGGGETRSIENPALAVSPALLDGLWGYGPTRSGVQINEDTSLTFSAVFAAAKVLSESVGMLPLAVYEGDDDNDVRVRAKDHPAYKLVRWSPNEEQTAASFKEALQANLSLWGNGYARIEVNNRDEPIALRPLLSSQVHPERYAGELRYVVRNGNGGRFAPEEMIAIPAMSLNGLKGLSPVAYCRESIATGKAAEIFGSTFFGNGANLRGTLTFPAGVNLTPEQIRAIRESFDAQYAGVGNANKTGIVPFGGTYAHIGIPPDDAQFLQTRQFSIQEVARIFRVPPHMLADLSRSTNNNIEQCSLEFLIYTLLPWLEKWEQELTRKLCPGGQFHCKFDTARMIRADLTARLQFYQSGSQWGYLNPDTICAMEGLPLLPNGQGKIYRTPVNMEPMEILAKLAAGGIRPTSPTPAIPPGVGAAQPAVRELRPFLVDALNRMQRKELNAIRRGKADDDFYSQHGRHVREAMLPVLIAAVGNGTKLDPAMPTIGTIADTRHVSDPSWVNSAESDADQIINAIEVSLCKQPAPDAE